MPPDAVQVQARVDETRGTRAQLQSRELVGSGQIGVIDPGGHRLHGSRGQGRLYAAVSGTPDVEVVAQGAAAAALIKHGEAIVKFDELMLAAIEIGRRDPQPLSQQCVIDASLPPSAISGLQTSRWGWSTVRTARRASAP